MHLTIAFNCAHYHIMENYVIGTSDATEAEYGYKSDQPVTMLQFYNGEFAQYWGYATIEIALDDLKRDYRDMPQPNYEVL